MWSKLSRKLKIFWIRLTHYEYWTWWAFFIPILPSYLFYALRLRNIVYFTAANPGIEYGGFFGEKKNEILQNIPAKYKPASHFFDSNQLLDVLKCLNENRISYPIIFKPDVGERGDEVVILRDDAALEQHLKEVNYPFLIQTYVETGIELGVFYSRLPDSSKGQILSIVQKKFLSVVGDGISDVATLLSKSNQGLLQMSRLEKERPKVLSRKLNKGEHFIVERIGNHCLGTEFMNANHLINDRLNSVFDEISIPFEGFYFGRYDLKIETIEKMYDGEGIQIFELNGVTSEPGHIYDRQMTLFQAYSDLIKNQKVLFKICKQNLKRNVQTATFREIVQRGFQHFFKAKR